MTIDRLPFGEMLQSIAARTPTPGGGAVAAATGALAAAMAGMVVAYSIGKKSLAEHQAQLTLHAEYLSRARSLFLQLAEEDAAAYALVNELSRLPDSAPERAGLPEATLRAVQAPEAVMAAGLDLLRLLESVYPMTNKALKSDWGVAAELAEAAVRAGSWNVWINAGQLPPGERATVEARRTAALAAAADLRGRVAAQCVG